jgi:hypothetical protein
VSGKASHSPAVSPARSAAAAGGSHPLLAAALGAFIGAALSLLVLRQRLLDGIRSLLGRDREISTGLPIARQDAPVSRSTPVKPIPIRTGPPREDTMVVEEIRPEATQTVEDTADNLAANAAEPTGPNPVLRTDIEPTMAARVDAGLADLYEDVQSHGEIEEFQTHAASATGSLDLDLTGALDHAANSPHVEQIGWVGDDAADLTRTHNAAVPSPTEELTAPMDLNSLANNDTNDEKLSQTLRDALALLEKDYEEEFTASQVMRMKHPDNPAPTGEQDENTVVRTGTGPHRR